MTEPQFTDADGDLTREGEGYTAGIGQRRQERDADQVDTPAQDQAVVLAKVQFEGWLKDNFDRDLNGRQRDLIARVALEIMYPTLKIALAHDYADALDASELGFVGAEVAAALRESVAEDFTKAVNRASRS